MDKLTKEELQAIRERVEKATPGLWHFDIDDADIWCRVDTDFPLIMTIAKAPEDEDRCLDFEFISHSREDVPKLLDEIQALRDGAKAFSLMVEQRDKEVERLRGALEQIESISRNPREYMPSMYSLNHIARQAMEG